MKHYIPSAEETEKRVKAYGYLKTMIELKNKPMPHFSGPDGERSWNDMVDDSEMILNGYTQSRASQGKEDWQSNMMDNVSRVKMKAVAAGVGLQVPGTTYKAKNKDGVFSMIRAEIFKEIVKGSFAAGNPTLSSFREVWHMLSHGVVVEYEGYKTGGAMRERVVSFDSLTGEVQTKKEYVKFESKPYNLIINPNEFFWWTFHTNDVQKQPRVALLQSYGKAELEAEFSKYPKYNIIKDFNGSGKQISAEIDTTFSEAWNERNKDTGEEDYEVFRLYDKENGLYQIWINGILIFESPILWGSDDEEEKLYPFVVQQAEYYANTNFFVGMPFGQIMEAYQEHKNTVINTIIDKLYRSAKKPFLIGLQDKDLFDVQDQFIDEDNKYYVPDINAVKPFPYEGPNQGEFMMLSILDKGLEMISVDRAQQGQSAGGSRTAREVVIADQRAQEIKGSLYLALENLWLQKTRLRNAIVLSHYLKDKAAAKDRRGQIITVHGYEFGDGVRGTLDIHVANSKSGLLTNDELESRAMAMEEQGMAYKIISITKDYLTNWKYDYEIVPDSFHKKEKELEQAEFDSEVLWLANLAPDFLAANKESYLKEKLAFRGKRIEDYKAAPPPQPKTMPDAEGKETPIPEGMGGNDAFAQGVELLNQS